MNREYRLQQSLKMVDIKQMKLKLTKEAYSLNHFWLTINIINLINNKDISVETQYLNLNLFFYSVIHVQT